MPEEPTKDFPIGAAFLELTQTIADKSSKDADEFMRMGGEKLPTTMAELGTVLSYLYRAASCSWGCPGGDHQVEWLCGRIVNQAMSALRLIRAGSYDEALVLIRAMGEITNLLWLFWVDRQALGVWKAASRKVRWKEFRPKLVRLKLAATSTGFVPIDDDRYGLLCEMGTHPVPTFGPGQYNHDNRPTLGMVVQELGVFVTTAELAYATAMSAIALTKLLTLSDNLQRSIQGQSRALIRAIGRVNILNIDEARDVVRTEAVSRKRQTEQLH